MSMDEVKSSVHVLSAVSSEHLTADDHVEQEKIVTAMVQVLCWLHQQIATPIVRDNEHHQAHGEDKASTTLSTLEEVLEMFCHWYNLQQKTEAMSWRLWMLWTQMGCSLHVLQCCKAMPKTKECALLVMTSHVPNDFLALSTHFDKEKQAIFSRELWDTVVAKPLYGASTEAVTEAASGLIDVFLHWMAVAMCGCELVFIANVTTSFQKHLQSSSDLANNLVLKDAWLRYVNLHKSVNAITDNTSSVAVTAIVLSALTSACRSFEAANYLESLSAATVDELSHQPFVSPHCPIAGVAMALGLVSLDDTKLSGSPTTHLRSENATVLSLFALLRLVCLPLISARLQPYDDATYQTEVHTRIKALADEPSRAIFQELSLRMVESCIEEVIQFYKTSFGMYGYLMKAMQSVLSKDLFRLKKFNQLQTSDASTVHDDSLLISAPEVVKFVKHFYGTVAPMFDVLSSCHLVRSFVALSRIEFARELCASPAANAVMKAVTQRLEQALEQTTTSSATIFAPVLRSFAMHSTIAKSAIPPEVDIVVGCQALAVGLVMQRKLRILLFQCPSLIDDALSVAFFVLYNVFEPADAFGHRFIGVCLSRLAQFTPLLTVFPHYLHLTLVAYPANASPQALTKACGTIFGSLFYSEGLTISDNEDAKTTRAMVLWAIRKCCERSTELLAAEEKEAVTHVQAEPGKVSAEEKDLRNATSRETDGLYIAGLVFELMKIAPVDIVKAISMEVERLLASWKHNDRVLSVLKSALFARISQNCEAEKRAWFAAWYIEVDHLYPVEASPMKRVAASRL